MPALSSLLRSRLLWIVCAILLLVGLAIRFWLGGYVVRTVLTMAGASDIRFGRVEATPWRVEVQELSFSVRAQGFSARRVTVERDTWWMASLGRVRVAGAQFAAVIDGSDVNPRDWATYTDSGLGDEPVNLPFQSLDLEGTLVVRMASLPDQPIALKLEARPKGGASWIGSLIAGGPGFRLVGGGSLLRAGQELDFQVLSAELDLEVWQAYIQRLVLLPGAPWAMGGKLTGVAEGKVTAKRFAATARVSLRDGRMQAGTQDIAASGLEADLEFSDLWKLRTKTGSLHVQELRVGRLPFRDGSADLGLWGGETIIVNSAEFRALGGSVRVAPVRFQLNQREIHAELEVKDLDLARLAEWVPDLPAQVAGRVSGRLPLLIQDTGVRLENGRLHLSPGTAGSLRMGAPALLRSGATLAGTGVAGLKDAGNRTINLDLRELDFVIRPEGLPLGCSARLDVAGETDAGPLAVSFNVNGAVERYLQVLP